MAIRLPATIAPAHAVDDTLAVEAEEHAAEVLRLRKAIAIGMCVWPLFGVLDWMVVTWIEPGRLWWYLAIRFAELPILGAMLWRLGRRTTPSRWGVQAWQAFGFGTASAAVALMAIEYRGLASPYAAGIGVILVCRAAFLGQHWRTALAPVAATVLAFPATLLAAAPFVPEIAAQLGDPGAVAEFSHYQFFVLGTAFFTIVGGHVVWALRRQVFEARSIGRYRLRRRLGRGGMGDVWAAYHPGLRREVALKILRPDLKNANTIRRFELEVRAMTELTHPNTVRVFDYGVTEDGLWFYAMELLEGKDLAALVERDGPLPPPRAIHLVTQAARALAEAHALFIVHRDVKPNNLFVTRAGGESDYVKVLDFGIAKLWTLDPSNTLSAGSVAGTPAYMSPEVAAGGPATPRSDVYGLGASLYFALTGKPPFDAESGAALMHAQLYERPRSPSERLGAMLPPDLEALVLRCLEKCPEDRFASGRELADALSGCDLAGSWRPPLVTPVPSDPSFATAPTIRGHVRA